MPPWLNNNAFKSYKTPGEGYNSALFFNIIVAFLLVSPYHIQINLYWWPQPFPLLELVLVAGAAIY